MSLLAYNLTIAPLPLAAGAPIVTLPASASAGARGQAVDVTAEMNALAAPDFALLQVQVAAGSVQYEWSTGIPEFNTFTLVVGQAAEEFAENNVSRFADPAGNDNNPGTQTAPVLTYRKGLSLIPGAWRRSGLAFLGAGTYAYNELGANANVNGQVGLDSSPLAFVGAYSILTSFVVTAVNADGSISVAAVPALATGTGDSFAFASPLVTLTDAAGGFVAAGVKAGMSVTIAGATTPANNGTYVITAATPTTLTFINPAGVAEAYAGTWDVTVDRFFGTPRMIVMDGPAAGQSRGCAGNTTTSLIPSQPYTGIAIGNTVQLETCATILTLSSAYALGGSWLVGFKGIKFQGAVGLFADFSHVTFEGCIMELSFFAQIARHATLRSPTNAGSWAPLAANNPFSTLRPFGLFFDLNPTGVANLQILQYGFLQGSHLYRNAQIQSQLNGIFQSNGGHGRNTSVFANTGGIATINPVFLNTQKGIWKGKHPGAAVAFQVSGGSLMTIDRAQVTDMIGTRAIFEVGVPATAGATSGADNSGGRLALGDVIGSANNLPVGTRAMRGSRVTIDANGVDTTMTGLGGDLAFQDATDVRTYASVRVADVNGVKAYVDPYGNVAERLP